MVNAIHQVMVGAAPGSSIWNEAIALRDALRGWGYRSGIYAGEAHAALRGEVRHVSEYRPQPGDALVYHFSTASSAAQHVVDSGRPVVLIYHNVTPSRYFARANARVAAQLDRAAGQLQHLRPSVRLAIAHSEFSRRDLIQAGFARTEVVPPLMTDTLLTVPPDRAVLDRYDDGDVNLLSVGRIVPNKRHEDAVKALHYFRRIQPNARLILAGAPDNAESYAAFLREVADSLGLRDRVVLCGHVADAQLAAYYRSARLFLCLSEHEGFCIPLVEAMRFGVPIVAFASSAIPETLGGAGVLMLDKNYPVMAEMIHLLDTDEAFRGQIARRQTARAAELSSANTLVHLRALIESTLEMAA